MLYKIVKFFNYKWVSSLFNLILGVLIGLTIAKFNYPLLWITIGYFLLGIPLQMLADYKELSFKEIKDMYILHVNGEPLKKPDNIYAYRYFFDEENSVSFGQLFSYTPGQMKIYPIDYDTNLIEKYLKQEYLNNE